MGFFSSIKKAARSVGRTIGKGTRGIRQGVKVIGKGARSVVKVARQGISAASLGRIVGKGLGFVTNLKNKVESAITKLPFGEELLTIAKLSSPQLMAFEAFLANGQQLQDFLVSGRLDVKTLATNAIKHRVPGWEKMEKVYARFDAAADLYKAVKANDPAARGRIVSAVRSAAEKDPRSRPYIKYINKGFTKSGRIRKLQRGVARVRKTTKTVRALHGKDLRQSILQAARRDQNVAAFFDRKHNIRSLNQLEQKVRRSRTAAKDLSKVAKNIIASGSQVTADGKLVRHRLRKGAKGAKNLRAAAAADADNIRRAIRTRLRRRR